MPTYTGPACSPRPPVHTGLNPIPETYVLRRAAHIRQLLALLVVSACTEGVAPSPPQVQTPAAPLGSISQSTSDSVPGAYIVVLRDDTPNVDAIAEETVRLHGGTRGHVFQSALKGFSVRDLPDAAVAALRENPAIAVVEPVRLVHAGQGTQSLPLDNDTYQFSSRWGLDRSDDGNTPVFDGTYSYYHTGVGVHLYIMDSGINGSHVEFAGRHGATAYGGCAINGLGFVGPWSDQVGHGTGVAGLAAGATYGVAKNAIIHSVRIFCNSITTSCDEVVAGLDWLVGHVEYPAVVNMSFGDDHNCFSVETATASVIAHGITAVKAAGNENIDAFQDRGNRPAGLIVVGASDQTDGRAFFGTGGLASNYGPTLALFAPGALQRSAGINSSTDSTFFNGTSAAAPLAAGAAANLLEAYPTYTPSQIRSMLVGNAANVTLANAGTGSPSKLLYAKIP